jgi:hypothetical protein
MALGLIDIGGSITRRLTGRSSVLLTVTLSIILPITLIVSAITMLAAIGVRPTGRRIHARRLLGKKRVWAAGKTDTLIKGIIPFIAKTTITCRSILYLTLVRHARLRLIKPPARLTFSFILR